MGKECGKNEDVMDTAYYLFTVTKCVVGEKNRNFSEIAQLPVSLLPVLGAAIDVGVMG